MNFMLSLFFDCIFNGAVINEFEEIVHGPLFMSKYIYSNKHYIVVRGLLRWI